MIARPVGGLIGLTLVGAGIPVYLFGASRFVASGDRAPDGDLKGDEQTA
jgi:hypothetical protein